MIPKTHAGLWSIRTLTPAILRFVSNQVAAQPELNMICPQFTLHLIFVCQVIDASDPGNIQLRIHEDPFCETDGRAHFQ